MTFSEKFFIRLLPSRNRFLEKVISLSGKVTFHILKRASSVSIATWRTLVLLITFVAMIADKQWFISFDEIMWLGLGRHRDTFGVKGCSDQQFHYSPIFY